MVFRMARAILALWRCHGETIVVDVCTTEADRKEEILLEIDTSGGIVLSKV
jgi:hypothetical protein